MIWFLIGSVFVHFFFGLIVVLDSKDMGGHVTTMSLFHALFGRSKCKRDP